MLTVGLTGGIGCGKSTVARLFTALNVPLIDADHIAHQLTAVGQPALAQIVQLLGDELLNNDASLNRRLLRERIFTDTKQKHIVESVLHPLIYQQIETEIHRLHSPYCLIAIPLLFETHMTHKVQRVLVVDCPVELQLQRVQQRDASSPEKIQAIINSQVSRTFRQTHTDDIIDNSATLARGELVQQVNTLHHLYLSLSDTGRFCL